MPLDSHRVENCIFHLVLFFFYYDLFEIIVFFFVSFHFITRFLHFLLVSTLGIKVCVNKFHFDAAAEVWCF